MYGHYLGIDLHRKRSYSVLMDARGEISYQHRLDNGAMEEYVKDIPKDTLAVIEATGNWRWLYDALQAADIDVVLAHPKKVRAIAAARIKTDRIDATTLAHLARSNLETGPKRGLTCSGEGFSPQLLDHPLAISTC